MMSVPEIRAVSGSHREPLPGAKRVAAAPPDERLSVTVRVRRRPGAERPAPRSAAAPMSRTDFAATYGADPGDIDRVTAYAREQDLEVGRVDQAGRSVELSGTVAAMSRAFGVELARYELPDSSYRGREGAVHVPAELADVVEGVFGLDDRPQARSRLHRGGMAAVGTHAEDDRPFTPPQVGDLYDFPCDGRGRGQTVAIIELGGGYHDVELNDYFARLGLPRPTVTAVGIDGASNAPGDPADGEVVLDIEVVGAIAPEASIVVYFAPNSDRGFLDAITTAVHDGEHTPSAISISWGASESAWTPQAMRAFDDAFADAATLGVTVLCAAGDHGAADAVGDGTVHADFPASSPHVIACGGTTLRGHASTISDEVVWNAADGWATGGGISDFFDLPGWQQGAGVPPSLNDGGRVGRGVPDVAGNADSATGYLILLDGQVIPIGGTSAVAPLYAGLVALLNADLDHPVGYLNPILYGLDASAKAFRDILAGDNSVPASQFGPATVGYPAGAGWDACTGLGSIDGKRLLAALHAAARQPVSVA